MAELWVWDGKNASVAESIVDTTTFLVAACTLSPDALASLPGIRIWVGPYPVMQVHGADPIAIDSALSGVAMQCEWSGHRVTIMKEPCWFPETQRYLKLQGSDLFLAPYLNDRSRYTALWRDAQQNQYIGVSFWPTPQLVLPCEMTEDSSGIRAGFAVEPGLWRLRWDWQEFFEIQKSFPVLASLRPDVYRRHRWWRSS